MSLNVKTILQLIVPEYIITGFTFIAIFLLSSKQLYFLPLLMIPFVVYLLALFGFNVINQVFDVGMDAITKPKRPIPSKKVTKQEATIFAGLLFGVSLILAFFSQLLLPWFLFVISIFLYSHPKIFLRRYLPGTPLFGIVFYSLIPFLFVSTFFGLTINYLFLLFFSLVVSCVSILKDIEDIPSEKKFGIKSIPRIFGGYTSAKVSFFSVLAMILVFGVVLSISNLLFVWSTIISLLIVFVKGNFILNKKNFGKTYSYSKILAIFMILTVIIQLAFGLTAFFI
jgi:geranylgeranylglycerol-phosphate geranylgeranyltransferase